MSDCVCYYRTSSLSNVGEDKDSRQRQQFACETYAVSKKLKIVASFEDMAVSGADPLEDREGFSNLLAYLSTSDAKIILVENATRFARDTLVSLTGFEMLKSLGYNLVPTDAPTYFTEPSPTSDLIRTILTAVSSFEKATVVARLAVARQRKRKKWGRCEGRIPYTIKAPELIKEAKRLARRSPKTGKSRSLNTISKELFILGYSTKKGNKFSASQIQRLIK